MASNPSLSALRLLILSPHQSDETTTPSPFPPLLSALTSTAPSSDLTSFAGYTSHPALHLKTKYYERNVGIWCDELPPVHAPGKGPSRASTADTAASKVSALPTSPTTALPSITGDVLSSPTNTTAPPDPGPSSSSPTKINSPVKAPTATNDEADTNIPTDTPKEITLKDWKNQFLSPLASEVLSSIGSIILILPIPADTEYPSTPQQKVELMEYMSAVNEVKDAIEDLGRDVGGMFVLQPTVAATARGDVGVKGKVLQRLEGLVEKFEDKCHEMGVFGWDFVWWDGVSEPTLEVPKVEVVDSPSSVKKDQPLWRNEYGEKVGVDRVREVLEGVDWSISPSLMGNLGGEDAEGAEGDDKFDVFGGERYQGLDAELQQEMMGLKLSIMDPQGSKAETSAENDGEDISMDQMSALMERVVAIREAGADMEGDEKQKFAKREVEKIMQEIG